MTAREAWSGAPWRPRAWQRDALPEVVRLVTERKRPVVHAVMGAGKSVLLAELAWMAEPKVAAAGRHIVVLAPTQDLVAQLHSTVSARISDAGMFYAEHKQHDRRVVVACNASVKRLLDIYEEERRAVGLLIVDECHRSEGRGVLRAFERMSRLWADGQERPPPVVGFSATPFRADNRQALRLFDSVAYSYGLGRAVEDGNLVPWRIERHQGPAGQDALLGALAMTVEHRHHGPTVISAPSVADARWMARALVDLGVSAEPVHGGMTMQARNDALGRLRRGEVEVVTYCRLLSEGVDMPWLRVLCMAAHRGSRVQYLQEFGRVLRAMPEADEWGRKNTGIVLDPHNLYAKHNLSPQPQLGPWALPESDEAPEAAKGESRGPRSRNVSHLPPAEYWCNALYQALSAMGADVRPKSFQAKKEWRDQNPTAAQLRTLRAKAKWVRAVMPESHARAAAFLADGADEHLSKWAVSRLLSALHGTRSLGRWPDGLWVPVLQVPDLKIIDDHEEAA